MAKIPYYNFSLNICDHGYVNYFSKDFFFNALIHLYMFSFFLPGGVFLKTTIKFCFHLLSWSCSDASL